MIRRLFIANRGEISLRIIRTARKMGITSILGVSEADKNGLPARRADEVVLLGAASSSESYLNIEKVVDAAKSASADAVHPGYGFLSENAEFAIAVKAAGMIFVGPDVSSLIAMGDKLMARKVGIEAGLLVVPGGEAATKADALKQAENTGYPLLIKAVSGGGGRGMKRVDRPEDLDSQIDLAMAEARVAFGDPRVYVERFISAGRHVEVQVLGDGSRAVHLGSRDCSIQRRFQKLVEEAPAPDIPEDRHEALLEAALKLTNHLNYRGAGTVEFLVDADTFEFYFLEMNARIQVEHTVTEEVCGVDLIEQQILIADGLPLGLEQRGILPEGHAIEVRINAEDWQADFRPSPGDVTKAGWPAGVGIRVDSHIVSGGTVPPNYDSLMGKVIAYGANRAQAIERLEAALSALTIEPLSTTVGLHRAILKDERFRSGAVDTRFFEEFQNG